MALAVAAPAADDPCRVPDAPARGRGRRRPRRLRQPGRGPAPRGPHRTRRTSGRAARPTSSRRATCSTAGTDARKVLDLLMRLEGEARKAGGRVHALLGNHEVMNMLGDLRYVNAEEYKSFAGAASRRGGGSTSTRRPRPGARGRAKAAGQPFDEDAFRAKFMRAGAARLRRADRGLLGGGPLRPVAARSGPSSRRSTASSSSTAASPPRWRRSAARRSTPGCAAS